MEHGTKTQLARAIGITPQAMSRIVKRQINPSWPTAKKLAEVTGAEPQVFMDGSKEDIIAAIEAWEQQIT